MQFMSSEFDRLDRDRSGELILDPNPLCWLVKLAT